MVSAHAACLSLPIKGTIALLLEHRVVAGAFHADFSTKKNRHGQHPILKIVDEKYYCDMRMCPQKLTEQN